MKFKNKQNSAYQIAGNIIWNSRSVAVVGCIILIQGENRYVLVSKRGPKSPNFIGKMNLVAGYLDWNETGTEAVYRETWEETGFNLPKYLKKFNCILNNLKHPWFVNTSPNSNLQNVTLRYGAIFNISENVKFPKLTTRYNEVYGETENPMWMPISEVNNYEWAFDHDSVIKLYNNKL